MLCAEAVTSSYLVIAGTWYKRMTTPLLHSSSALWLSHAHDLGGAELGEEREARRPCVFASDTINSDLKHCMPRLAPRNIPATYV